ncbi:MAG: ribose 5-phosphate isomerase A [Candidatus Bathyarchaeota archaeon]|nr:ribose 5-phosphate isomerase A [Candidatus Bathyarchaeota archaeon]
MKPSGKSWVKKAKWHAAIEAVKHVKDGFVIGLGSGSTVVYAAEEMGRKVKRGELRIKVVPTSYQSLMLAVDNGIPITTLDENPILDLTIDGADQIDESLNLIKGMGGALTREKIVASASKELIIIADESKKVGFLGENNHPVPIEILPFALKPAMLKIEELGGKPRLRESHGKVGPVVTDNGNFIVDAYFGVIKNPADLDMRLDSIPGVVETGLFAGMAKIAYLGKQNGVERLDRK